MDIETLITRIVSLAKTANEQMTIIDGKLSSYEHGKIIAYEEILSLIFNGTSLLSDVEQKHIKEELKNRNLI